MAGSTREIKRKIRSVNSTMQITKAFELVSTAKLKRARDRMDVAKPYFNTIQEAVRDILKSDHQMKSKFISTEESQKPLYIVITSDRGLCGGYNINAIKKAIEGVQNKSNAKYIAIGKKAHDILLQNGYDVIDSFLYISEKPEFLHATQIAKVAMGLFEKGEVDSIQFVFTEFASTISQVAKRIQLLPIVNEASEAGEKKDKGTTLVNYEPSIETVLDYIIPKYIESTLYGGLIESSASEQAARRIAMENASENAEEIIEDLTLYFNQARQAAITQELSDIVGGAEALK